MTHCRPMWNLCVYVYDLHVLFQYILYVLCLLLLNEYKLSSGKHLLYVLLYKGLHSYTCGQVFIFLLFCSLVILGTLLLVLQPLMGFGLFYSIPPFISNHCFSPPSSNSCLFFTSSDTHPTNLSLVVLFIFCNIFLFISPQHLILFPFLHMS